MARDVQERACYPATAFPVNGFHVNGSNANLASVSMCFNLKDFWQ
jgi:hypothetical protein